ncbi:MAG: hypothetical protein IBJ13_11590 [Sphingopyxis sp.]|nr:hypothetical protein [Sphingopyxis sp.]
MNGWWFAAGCVVLYLLLWGFMAQRWKQQAAALAGRRQSPDREGFLKLLGNDSDRDVAEFVWAIFEEEYSYKGVDLTPHPDDDYLKDMPIDPENQNDWFDDFCKAFYLRSDDFPDWPKGEATTIRNFARWLSDGRRSLARANT